MTENKKKDYIVSKVNAFKKERMNQRDAAVEVLAYKLQTEIPEAIQKCEKVPDLKECDKDISRMLNFLVEVMGVKPKDV